MIEVYFNDFFNWQQLIVSTNENCLNRAHLVVEVEPYNPAMRFLKLLLVLSFSSLLQCNRVNNLSYAVSIILKQISLSKFDLLHVDLRNRSDENLEHFLIDSNKKYPKLFFKRSLVRLSNENKRLLVLLSVDDSVAAREFLSQCSSEFWLHDSFYIIVVKSSLIMREIFIAFWNRMIANVNILIDDEASDTIEMFTFYPFDGHSCNSTSPLRINEYGSIGKWSTDVFFPKKFTNLHQCPLNVMTYQIPPAIIIDKLEKSLNNIRGFEGELFAELGRHFNFSSRFDISSETSGTGPIYANGKELLLDCFDLIDCILCRNWRRIHQQDLAWGNWRSHCDVGTAANTSAVLDGFWKLLCWQNNPAGSAVKASGIYGRTALSLLFRGLDFPYCSAFGDNFTVIFDFKLEENSKSRVRTKYQNTDHEHSGNHSGRSFTKAAED